ncbi:hypothetical protein LG314_05875 [Agrococcus terreus]|uniref:hypothetical protein n=1 Tax=Agrococcus terreus TaxID=574649 RepID=UPI003850AD5A
MRLITEAAHDAIVPLDEPMNLVVLGLVALGTLATVALVAALAASTLDRRVIDAAPGGRGHRAK